MNKTTIPEMMRPIKKMRNINIILVLTNSLTVNGRTQRFQIRFPSLPIELIPKTTVPKPMPNRIKVAKNENPRIAVGGGPEVLVEEGKGDAVANNSGRIIINGIRTGSTINLVVSRRRVADLNSYLSNAAEIGFILKIPSFPGTVTLP